MSYSIYLLHMPVMFCGMWLLTHANRAWSHWTFFGALLALTVVPVVILGALIFEFVEKPFIQWAKKAARAVAPIAQPEPAAVKI